MYIERKKPLTRSNKGSKVYTRVSEVAAFIKDKLALVLNTQERQSKILIIEELFKMLSENMWFVNHPDRKYFKNTLQLKLIELFTDWERADHYHLIIIGQHIDR